MSLLEQLARSLFDSSERTPQSRSLFKSSIVLASDLGLVRQENQDRLVFARIFRSQSELPINLLAVSDGMGGMVGGAACATLTLAGLIREISGSPANTNLVQTLVTAAHAANEVVYSEFSGNGGATLSAIAWNSTNEFCTVNIGDSRIFHQIDRTSTELYRLTVDDTMREAFGSEGKGLIQFIGIGKGLKPHTSVAEQKGSVILTTDGIHFIEHNLLSEIVMRASSSKSKADRVTALARWLGGPDNASVAVVDFDTFPQLPQLGGPGIEVWSCSAESINIWNVASPKPTYPKFEVERQSNPLPIEGKKTRKRKPTIRKSKDETQKQLEIEIEVVEGEDADRK